MKFYGGAATSIQQQHISTPTLITTTTTATIGADLEVPNTDRLAFRGLANNHHYIIQNRIYSHAPTSPSDNKMSPTATHASNNNNNVLKVVGTSTSNNVGPHSPCGDGDLCEWDWGLSSLSHQTSQPPMEWFSPLGNANPDINGISHITSPTAPEINLNSTDSNGDVHQHPNSQKSEDESFSKNQTTFPNHRPSSLEFLNQNGNDDANSHNYNADEDEAITQTLADKRIRSSSLKTIKTPPGTPGHKKIVRFADCLGLDLVDVKLFLDEIPNVPRSAFSDLQDAIDQREEEVMQRKNKANKLDRTLLPSFHQPVEMGDFFDRVDAQKVLLENCYLLDSHQIKGCVRVKNLDFNKAVFLRFTYNDWDSYEEIPATYSPGSCDGFSDRFEFNMTVDSNRTKIGCKFAFACRYECLSNEFWDNNCGRNYVFHCVPSN